MGYATGERRTQVEYVHVEDVAAPADAAALPAQPEAGGLALDLDPVHALTFGLAPGQAPWRLGAWTVAVVQVGGLTLSDPPLGVFASRGDEHVSVPLPAPAPEWVELVGVGDELALVGLYGDHAEVHLLGALLR